MVALKVKGGWLDPRNLVQCNELFTNTCISLISTAGDLKHKATLILESGMQKEMISSCIFQPYTLHRERKHVGIVEREVDFIN